MRKLADVATVAPASGPTNKQRIFEVSSRSSRGAALLPEDVCAPLSGRLRTIGEQILRAIEESKIALPVLPEHAAKAMQVATNNESSFQDYESVIRNNPAMAAKLLRMANSPLYGIAREITSIRQAMLVLGTGTLSQMLMQLVVESNAASDPQDAPVLANEHQHALAVGHFASLVATELGHGSPEAFLCGLLHDFGRLVFPATGRALGFRTDTPDLRQVADVLHGPLGAFMAQAWRLPALVEEATLRHHDFFFNAVGRPYSQIGHIVACAERLAFSYGFDFGERLAECCDASVEISEDPAFVALELPQSLLDSLLAKANNLAQRLGSDRPLSVHAA